MYKNVKKAYFKMKVNQNLRKRENQQRKILIMNKKY